MSNDGEANILVAGSHKDAFVMLGPIVSVLRKNCGLSWEQVMDYFQFVAQNEDRLMQRQGRVTIDATNPVIQEAIRRKQQGGGTQPPPETGKTTNTAF